MILMTILLSVVIATGQGIKITDKDMNPYIRKFSHIYGHKPESFEEKREVLMNLLADKLMLKRAKEIHLDKDPTFLSEWSKAKKELYSKCEKNGIPSEKCKVIADSLKKVLLIGFLEEKEVLPKIQVSEDEIDILVENHRGIKRGKTLDRNGARQFLLEKKKWEVIEHYVKWLMKRYDVKINKGALKELR
ncbi:hypothetical protein TST_0958 [Thermosulfidibacter takaii ABI70S6]|uniref:PpiC domain-containing protein n=1 Tax=Thermosulfidibacter takaii (strain DSM 17441 / JCM 13301 / NBRC 103674 / ABI70S6) TaxID=1298851 RepID=A0A0S3QTY1_THET7|nr:hypothetical protein [Thermosulfidibacter takaii]BAT71756.1 hypothetical protein TST_0958 [Thermosulfidibacter takaii ABI70S6]